MYVGMRATLLGWPAQTETAPVPTVTSTVFVTLIQFRLQISPNEPIEMKLCSRILRRFVVQIPKILRIGANKPAYNYKLTSLLAQ